MPIYSPTGFLDVTNATLRTSNLEAENFKLNGGNIYVSTDFTVAPTLQLITNGGSVTSNTVEFTNPTTGLVVDSNIVVTGNVTAGYLYGDASNVTAVPAAQITGTLAVANGGTGTTTSTGTGSVVLSDAPTFTGDVTFDTNTLFVDSANDRVGVGTTTPGTTLDVLGNGAFLHTGSGTPHNSNDLILRLGGLNNGGGIIQSKCAIIATPDTAYGGEADYGRNAIHFCIDNSQTDTNASKSNHRISIKPDGLVGIRNANPVKRLHIKGYSNEILAGLDHVTAANDEHVGLGFGVTDGSQGNRIFKGGIFFERKGGITGRGDLLFCIENTGDNTSEVSPANEIMRITRNSVVGITGNLSVTGNATFDTDTLFVDSVNDRVGIGTTSPGGLLDIRAVASDPSVPTVHIGDNATDFGDYGMVNLVRNPTAAGSKAHLAFIRAGNTIFSQGYYNDTNTFGFWPSFSSVTNTPAMAFAPNGDVGIGTTDPKTRLHVGVGNAILRMGAVNYGGSAADTTTYGLERSRNQILFSTWRDALTDKIGAKICGINKQTYSSASLRHLIQSTDLAFFTVPPNAANYDDTIERLRITDTGYVGIGTTSPSRKLEVVGGPTKSDGFILGTSNNVYYPGCIYTDSNWGMLFRSAVSSPAIADFVFNDYTGSNMMVINNGNVGINQTSPTAKLHIKPDHSSYSNPADPVGAAGVAVYNETNSDPTITHSIISLRTGGSSGGDPFLSFDVAAEHGWSIGIDNSAGTQLRFGQSWSNFDSTKAYISQNSTAAEIDFTGQHRSFVSNVPHTEYLNLEGLIVSANKNQYFDIQEEIVTGVQAIKINESLPLVSISNVAYDKSCFGVISGSEDTNDREYSQGSFVSVLKKQEGDIRAHINSVGEGAIWVTNLNGTLESGDYITTSNIAGYGQKQDSEFLANYTVAKITMDCDFEPTTQPVQIIKKELQDVNYWVKYTYDDISEEEYTRVKNLGRRVRIIESGTEISQEEYENHVKKEGYTITESNTYIRNDTTYQRVFSDKEKEPKEGYHLEVRNEPVNVLDEHGQIQWEDDPSGATEKAYKIRYLDADGSITDEANHVYKAAFVGCTYHCG